MIIGDLKYKIIVQQLQKIKDTYGAEQEVYVNYLELRAGVKYISSTKQVENEALVNIEIVEFTTYYRKIPETCRICFNNKFYLINSISEIGFKEGLRISTELIQGIVGDNIQFISGSTLISQSGYEFADVAFSGDYDDLINKPSSSKKSSYAVSILAGGLSPADRVTYFFGNNILAPTAGNWNLRKFGVVKSGTIVSVLINVMPQSTQGTDEPWSMYMYINPNGIIQAQELDNEYLIDTVSSTDGPRKWLNESLSVPITTNDLIYFKWVSPNWVTNPVSCYVTGQILIEY